MGTIISCVMRSYIYLILLGLVNHQEWVGLLTNNTQLSVGDENVCSATIVKHVLALRVLNVCIDVVCSYAHQIFVTFQIHSMYFMSRSRVPGLCN